MKNLIPIIDIFAGPGGLGEGFSAYKTVEGRPVFKINLSIEMDKFAHQTLELRAFYRQFTEGKVPVSYYEYLQGVISRQELFERHPKESAHAQKEAWQAELGKTSKRTVKSRIEDALRGVNDWVLIGGPPCQAYSLAGRSKLRGQSKWKYARDHRHFLYREYLRILADHQPAVFVMENVKGLLSSKRTKKNKKNAFELIFNDLKKPFDAKRTGSKDPLSYKLFSCSTKRSEDKLQPKDFIVRSEEYGIPQARHRIIIFGIRSDIYNSDPKVLKKIKKQVSISEVVGDLPRLRSGLSKGKNTAEEWSKAIKEIEVSNWIKSDELEISQEILSALRKIGPNLSQGQSFTKVKVALKKYHNWYVDKKLKGLCNHKARAHIKLDLHRYFFAAVFAREKGYPPKLSDFPNELLPKHKNIKRDDDDIIFNDRFRVQLKEWPSTTVVSHISKDGHYYIHYDPSQCRSLTVREAARLQTFPDNYFFEGTRTQQYHQVGNAVPPMLAYKIADVIYKVLQDLKK